MPNRSTSRLRLASSSAIFTFIALLQGCSQLGEKSPTADINPEKSELALATSLNADTNCVVSAEDLEAFPALPALNVWDRIRAGYRLPEEDHQRIEQEMNWYARHPEYMQRVTERGSRYLFHIVEELERRGMPMEIALLPIVESAFDPFAYSHGRASGMWQIIPGTGKMLGLKQNWWYDGRRDVTASTDAALNYLEQLNKRFDGNWLLALAAYNSGAGNVNKALKKNQKRGKPLDFWSLDLPRETKAYVPRLLALSKLVAEPEKYSLTLFPVENEPHFSPVKVGSQIDLAQAAELAEIEMDILYHLNPAFNRWATDPKGPHTLLIPVDKAAAFEEKLKGIPEGERITWDRYTIRSGDTLSTIASKYNVSIDTLQSINQIRGSMIRAGKTLLVPVAAKDSQHYSYSVVQRLNKKIASTDQKESGQRIDYIVKNGDSFWTIGRKYKVSSSKIAKWNNMAPRDPIHPGQTLAIWTKEPSVSSSSGVIRKVSYKVRKGDSLYHIANKFSVSVNDILKWNSVNKSKYLQPGESLTLFVDVKNM